MNLPRDVEIHEPVVDGLDLPWRSIPSGLRVDSVVAGWIDTPYGAGQASKGHAVDCIRFGASVLYELRGFDGEEMAKRLDRLPQDTALHSRIRARSALRKILRALEPWTTVDDPDDSWEPGDVAVEHTIGLAPTHMAIVTSLPSVVAHATDRGVKLASVRDLTGSVRLYRPLDKENW